MAPMFKDEPAMNHMLVTVALGISLCDHWIVVILYKFAYDIGLRHFMYIICTKRFAIIFISITQASKILYFIYDNDNFLVTKSCVVNIWSVRIVFKVTKRLSKWKPWKKINAAIKDMLQLNSFKFSILLVKMSSKSSLYRDVIIIFIYGVMSHRTVVHFYTGLSTWKSIFI